MKKILLSLGVITMVYTSSAQVICAGISPTSIEGNYNFTWADPSGGDWTTPDFNVPGISVQDTLVIVDDGAAGTNEQGNPISAEGCNPLVNSTDVNGKIAVVYRNTCEFGTKALNAQNAGAEAVIIVNRDNEAVEMAGGADGGSVTIPVIMLSSNDGATLIDEMQTGPVVVFIGNKTGLYANDAVLTDETSLFSKSTGVPSQLAQNGSEFSIDLATRVFNFGTLNQSSMVVTASIDGPAGNVYNESISLPIVEALDSIDIAPDSSFSFPQFSLTSYPEGEYTLTYSVDLGVVDEYDADNSVSASFYIQDSIFAYTPFESGVPVSNNRFRPSSNNSTFSNCIVFDNPNGSRVGAAGLYFQASSGDTNVSLIGQEIALYAYQWDNQFTDLDDPGLAVDNLNTVEYGFYYFEEELDGETVYASFQNSFALSDNQRYMFCVQTTNTEVFLGYNTRMNYTRNQNYYNQPLMPVESDGTYSIRGFGAETTSSVGVRIIDIEEVGIDENAVIEGSVAPNPATDVVRISVNAEGNANLVVADLSGKVVKTSSLEMNNGVAFVNIANLEDGMYIFNVTMENGQTAKINVVKK